MAYHDNANTVVETFLRGSGHASAGAFTTDGARVYSYAMVLAEWANGEIVVKNDAAARVRYCQGDKSAQRSYSVTTAKHVTYLLGGLGVAHVEYSLG